MKYEWKLHRFGMYVCINASDLHNLSCRLLKMFSSFLRISGSNVHTLTASWNGKTFSYSTGDESSRSGGEKLRWHIIFQCYSSPPSRMPSLKLLWQARRFALSLFHLFAFSQFTRPTSDKENLWKRLSAVPAQMFKARSTGKLIRNYFRSISAAN